MKLIKNALHDVLVLVLLVFAGGSSLAAQESETLATVAGQALTVADIEASISTQLADLEKQRQALIESALGPAVDRKLVQVEAEALGTTEAALLASEVTEKIPPVTPEDIDAWFNENRSRLQPSTTKEEVTDQISGLLRQERGQSAFRTYLATLRTKHEMRILFDPPRTEIDLADATWKGPEPRARPCGRSPRRRD